MMVALLVLALLIAVILTPLVLCAYVQAKHDIWMEQNFPDGF